MILNTIEVENIITTLQGCEKNITEEILLNRIKYSIKKMKKYRNKGVKKVFCSRKGTKECDKKLNKILFIK